MVKQTFLPSRWDFLFLDSNPKNLDTLYNNSSPTTFIYSVKKHFISICSKYNFSYWIGPHCFNNRIKFISIGDNLNSDVGTPNEGDVKSCANELIHKNIIPRLISNEVSIVFHGKNLELKQELEKILEPVKDLLYF